MLNGKPVNRFATVNQFSERITGYRIYRTPRRRPRTRSTSTA